MMLWCFKCSTFTKAEEECADGKELPHRRIRIFVPPHPALEARYAPKPREQNNHGGSV